MLRHANIKGSKYEKGMNQKIYMNAEEIIIQSGYEGRHDTVGNSSTLNKLKPKKGETYLPVLSDSSLNLNQSLGRNSQNVSQMSLNAANDSTTGLNRMSTTTNLLISQQQQQKEKQPDEESVTKSYSYNNSKDSDNNNNNNNNNNLTDDNKKTKGKNSCLCKGIVDLNNAVRDCILPHYFRWISRLLIMGLIIAATYFTVTISLEFSQDDADKWIQTTIITIAIELIMRLPLTMFLSLIIFGIFW